MTTQIILAGFGGQGILFAGKLLAYAGMLKGKEVSWLPSYGPEMRGGTANCNVIISDEPIASPIIQKPDALIALNLPSLEKFEKSVAETGKIYYDSSLISKTPDSDAQAFAVPATQMAIDMNANTLANMVVLGKFAKETGVITLDEMKSALDKLVPPKKAALLEVNKKALDAGYNL